MDGRTIVETFQASDTFQQVLLKTGLVNQTLMTTFPKRVYNEADSHKTLQELGGWCELFMTTGCLGEHILLDLYCSREMGGGHTLFGDDVGLQLLCYQLQYSLPGVTTSTIQTWNTW